MSDRYKGLVVTFEKDIRDDDAKSVVDAILMIKDIADVAPNLVSSDDYINRKQLEISFKKKIYEAIEN